MGSNYTPADETGITTPYNGEIEITGDGNDLVLNGGGRKLTWEVSANEVFKMETSGGNPLVTFNTSAAAGRFIIDCATDKVRLINGMALYTKVASTDYRHVGLVLIEEKTLSAAATEQTFTIPSGFKRLMIDININKSASTGSGFLGMRLNSQTGATAYKFQSMNYSTPASGNGSSFQLCTAGTGAQRCGGVIWLHVEEVDAQDSFVTGNVNSTDQWLFFGGRTDAGGTITAIKFDDYVSDSTFTGTIAVYGVLD